MRKKRQSSQQCHLVLLGPSSIRAAHKTLVKLTTGYSKQIWSVLLKPSFTIFIIFHDSKLIENPLMKKDT